MINRLKKRISRRDGIALVTTLIIIALLMVVVVDFNRIAITDIGVSRNFGDEKKILFTTISGVNAIRELLRLDSLYSKSDNLLEEWAKSQAYFDSASSMLDGGSVEGNISDEDGKIDVNSLINDKGKFDQAQKAIWMRLLSQAKFGLSEEQIETIIHCAKDWIDKDDEITGIYGVEDSFYLEKEYHCKNNILNNLEEMLLIKGVTKDIFYGDEYKMGVRSFFTVYGGGKININTAPIPVLMSLSDIMTEDIAKELDNFRQDDTNKVQLNDKKWYRKVWPYKDPLPESVLTTVSSFFTLHIKGRVGESVREIKTVIKRSGDSSSIIYWKEM